MNSRSCGVHTFIGFDLFHRRRLWVRIIRIFQGLWIRDDSFGLDPHFPVPALRVLHNFSQRDDVECLEVAGGGRFDCGELSAFCLFFFFFLRGRQLTISRWGDRQDKRYELSRNEVTGAVTETLVGGKLTTSLS